MANQVDSWNVKSPIILIPTTIEKAIELKKQYGSEAEFVSGATLLQLQWMNGRNIPDYLISLEQITELKSVQFDLQKGELSIGAITPLGSYLTNTILKEFPIICNALTTIAAPGVRNRGTIGGNIMGGIGDLIPFLLALNAKLVFQDEKQVNEMMAWDWLNQSTNKGQLLTYILIPLDKDILENYTFYRKIGRRETFTAAILTVSGKIKWDESSNIVDVKIAIGGGDNKPLRLEKTEQFIIGKKGEELDWKTIYSVITQEFIAAEDAFVTSNYRKKVAANLIVAELQSQFSQSGNNRGVKL
ncbi:FAD binding domain-containing protein [Lysinibacillus sp. SGAir0095]|uniref:FAD binding domain-containing protein n=1 Tax=Lysinibacillus sp. SGAir0095 TaxID=2070463 RepID=UPI0010CD02DE|nr:FAD binding domain-containing protein [Lysinibacillus sp. SGAir0095]QCR32370.1 hypothetical protein C1N55_09355 [Lysinibacillus sp. SGAir0095]